MHHTRPDKTTVAKAQGPAQQPTSVTSCNARLSPLARITMVWRAAASATPHVPIPGTIPIPGMPPTSRGPAIAPAGPAAAGMLHTLETEPVWVACGDSAFEMSV